MATALHAPKRRRLLKQGSGVEGDLKHCEVHRAALVACFHLVEKPPRMSEGSRPIACGSGKKLLKIGPVCAASLQALRASGRLC